MTVNSGTRAPPIPFAMRKRRTAFAAWRAALTRWNPNRPSPEVQFRV
jgi:hypothetical protein